MFIDNIIFLMFLPHWKDIIPVPFILFFPPPNLVHFVTVNLVRTSDVCLLLPRGVDIVLRWCTKSFIVDFVAMCCC